MHINNSGLDGGYSPAQALVLVIACLCVLLLAARSALISRTARKKKEQQENELRIEIEAAKEHVGQLPKLNTRWLLKMPTEIALKTYGADRSKLARSYGNRYNRLVVFDEQGDPWVGLMMPDTLENLRDSEYVQGDYFVPFRGPGEMLAGRLAIVGDYKIDIYPSWMNGGESATRNEADWNTWAQFEVAFTETFKDRNYHQVFRDILPEAWRREISEKRGKFNELCSRATA